MDHFSSIWSLELLSVKEIQNSGNAAFSWIATFITGIIFFFWRNHAICDWLLTENLGRLNNSSYVLASEDLDWPNMYLHLPQYISNRFSLLHKKSYILPVIASLSFPSMWLKRERVRTSTIFSCNYVILLHLKSQKFEVLGLFACISELAMHSILNRLTSWNELGAMAN